MRANEQRAHLSELPEVAYRKSGQPYNPQLELWDWIDGPFRLRLDFAALPRNFQSLKAPLKFCLMVFVKGYSPAYTDNLFRGFLGLARANPSFDAATGTLSPAELGNLAATLGPDREWYISALNPLLQKWFLLGLPGVSQECVDYLRSRRKPGNKKGAAVRTRDPDIGPFTDQEFQAIFRALGRAREDEAIPVWADVLIRLLAACGARPSQYASLKIKDVRLATADSAKRVAATLALPQIKKGYDHAREELKDFDLSARLAELVGEYIGHLVTVRRLGPEDALFPLSELRLSGRGDETRRPGDPFYGHPTGDQLSGYLNRAASSIAPASERVGFAPISLAPRRFRYTFGTRMAEEGASRAVIADRLGHTDLQNVEVYMEASPAIVDNIDRAMGAGLAPIAQAFVGQLIEGEHQARRRGQSGSRIIDFRVSAAPVGSCGSGAGCELRKPVACYTCHKFEPWLDGPHAEQLEMLLSEREAVADERVAGVNDDVIVAVREVIAECEAARRQRLVESAP